jgi:hypothetical protein
MNKFGLLFEYSNNIRILILLNKLPILDQNFKKIKKIKKNLNWVEIPEYHVFALKRVNKLLNWIFECF